MTSSRERYPPPWRAEELPGGWRVVSGNGFTLAWVYSVEATAPSGAPVGLTQSEAQAVAQAIANLGR